MIYIPILGAIALSLGTIFEKIILRKKKIDIKFYQVASFLCIIIAILPFLYFFWRVDADAFSIKNLFILALVIIFSIIANILVFYSLKWEKITNLEPARILEPLFIIILALILSFIIPEMYEGKLNVIIPAIIASIALIFPHIKKHHLKFNKYFISAIFGSFFFALELITSRLILDYYSAITFYFFRCLGVLLASIVILRPEIIKTDKKTKGIIFLTGVIWVLYRVVVYYGYVNYGVIFTTLILMLGPIFIYVLAHILLREKLNWKNITSSIIIVACVLYVSLS